MIGTLSPGISLLLADFQSLLQEHWPKLLALVIAAVPVLWGIYSARRQWRTREFMSRFSLSLNILRHDNGRVVLWIPAAGEYELEEVFHRNRTAVRIVRKAAYATTAEEPFLVTIPADDLRAILNEVANRIEVLLCEGSFAVLAGLSVRFLTLIIGLSCEKGADVRIRKIRALVVEEGVLRNIEQLAHLQFDKPHHAVRYQTLRHMAKLYAEQPDLFGRIPVALRVDGPSPAQQLIDVASRVVPAEQTPDAAEEGNPTVVARPAPEPTSIPR